ncbi:MAG: tRNA pseudouridine(38-40) synthase TruA [Paludibacteraceae bacterium]|nr:tRNA pseudouridine(38-40) synthase TruA [Paludibacteraceae bacterium]
MRYFVRFSYRGTDFHGSQSQPNAVTVQQTMEEAFSLVLRTPVALVFAGRTDAGVHARLMFAHFDFPESLDERLPNLADKLNSLLPSAIAIHHIWLVPDSLHARFSALSRTYEYIVCQRKDPFLQGRAARVAPDLDFDAMNEAARLLLGTHDFSSFCRTQTDVQTKICTLTEAEWHPVGDMWVFRITANRFLRNMVRAVVGTLFEVGRHRMTRQQFAAVLEARDRTCAGQSAPPEALYLTDIAYPAL